MNDIRVPASGLEWIFSAFPVPDPCNRVHFGLVEVPTGVIFDVVEFTSFLGKAVLDRLIDDCRPVGPVVLDGLRHRVLFLVPPSSETELEVLKMEHRIPSGLPMEVSGLGQSVRLPAPVTHLNALRRWLIVPRSRTPQLTAVDDLMETVVVHMRERVKQTPSMPDLQPRSKSRLLVGQPVASSTRSRSAI